jgi:DNA-directed RNA polymerase specialized sigma24 family protein
MPPAAPHAEPLTPALLTAALAGDAGAVSRLVGAMTPIVQARVARVLLRRASAGRGRDVRQELFDLAQEVFAALFADGGRLLRLWSPDRGLSLANFVGLLAEREAISILRSGRRSPWTEDPTEETGLDAAAGHAEGAEGRLAAREFLERILDLLRARLSPKALQLFIWLLVEQLDVEEVCRRAELTPDAVYAWRSRLGRTVRLLAAEISTDAATSTSESTSEARSPEQKRRRPP